MTTYVLAGSKETAIYEAQRRKFKRPEDQKSYIYGLFVFIGPDTWRLAGTNIVPGDEVLFAYGTTAKMIDRFVDQALTRGTRLSDLKILV